ncbi:hypothetical protein [Spirosoma aureum]|uniref:hypothetical protein n=1 Tax=Spirosoma aureum TaxID=2692134 RepID=UPI001E4D0517|nr:hypothetical protein [Spirosoma aureum]
MKTRLIITLFILLFTTAGSYKAIGGSGRDKPAVSPETDQATRAVQDFLHWYKTHIDSASRIILVNQLAGKPYSVNVKNGERYLAYLRSSHLLTDAYLAEWKTYFHERQAGFRASPQNEGPPLGFEYDLVLLSQDVDQQLASLKTLKIENVKVRQDRATVKLLLLYNYEFRLVKINNRWLINEILNLSAE